MAPSGRMGFVTSSRIRLLAQRLSAHPRRRDAVVAVSYLLLGLALLQLGGYRLWSAAAVIPPASPWSQQSSFLLLLIVMSALAAARSTHPFLVLAAGTPFAAADVLLGGSLGVVILFADFIYCAFLYGSDRGVRTLLVIIVAVCVATGMLFLVWPSATGPFAIVAVQWALIVMIAALWGWNVRSERQRTQTAMAEEHLRATERLRQRIAHDLHDLVANQIAVAGLNIEAARLQIGLVPDPPGEWDETLAQAMRGAEEAHSQLRRLIAVLTTVDGLADAPVATHPQARSLEALVPVGRRLVRRGGELADGLAALTPGAGRIVSRVLAELVANAVKHGSGDIVLDVTDADVLTVRLSNRVIPGGGRAPGSGIGITGAQLLLGGSGASLESAPSGEGEWSAVLTISEEAHV